MVGVTIWRLLPLPQTLTTAPVTRRSRLTALRLAPRSTVMWEFCRTWKAELPITNTRREPGPVTISSPLCTPCWDNRRRPFTVASPTSSTTLLRDWACAAAKPPMLVHAAAACKKPRRWNHSTSLSLRPSRVCWVMRVSWADFKGVVKREIERSEEHGRHGHAHGKQQGADQLWTPQQRRNNGHRQAHAQKGCQPGQAEYCEGPEVAHAGHKAEEQALDGRNAVPVHQRRGMPEQQRQRQVQRHGSQGGPLKVTLHQQLGTEFATHQVQACKLPAVHQRRQAHDQQKAQRIQPAQHQHAAQLLLPGAESADQHGRHGELALGGLLGGRHQIG